MPKYSQVFLTDKRVCAEIVSALDGEKFENLVEIGPGRGALTDFLYPRYGPRFKAVEIDPEMADFLRGKYPGISLVNRDFLELDLAAEMRGAKTAFIGNLPYSCSTPILERVLRLENFALAVFMFQKEVARKLTAERGTHDYGYLSISAQARADITLLADVGAASFQPEPEVDSSVLVLRPRKFLAAELEKELFSLLKSAFSHRRKTLVNSLALSGRFSKTAVESALSKINLESRVRPQELSLEDYLKLIAELRAR
ncbi:MAG: 16S rRNA (adenine(1518)-N(6)/adenine(1519)-N(6))-dimethyltransferase RsmA [Elusimicrobia bacterium]|nr:16S rRNA (adenine(1518)-N(6)/adenine(1519)-N(6))-dimethyltransferase RsmA [Elusimicrobiota bacterium]